jgi:hypothetical protein
MATIHASVERAADVLSTVEVSRTRSLSDGLRPAGMRTSRGGIHPASHAFTLV